MAAKKKTSKVTAPADMNQSQQKVFLEMVSKEVDRLLERRGCILEFKPGLALAANGTYTIGVAAQIAIKPKAN